MNTLDYFLELAAIDNVHPNERDVLEYVKTKLDSFSVPYKQDDFGNIVGYINSPDADDTIGICGHVDIAASLNGRQIIREDDIIKTDGISLLGGDDKTAVAAMLALAEGASEGIYTIRKNIELIFTVGEESGMLGAKNLDYSLLKTKDILVFDWVGKVNRIITRSPAYVKIDVEYIGKSAHPAEWEKGVNAGANLLSVASDIAQGEYRPGVTHNIGKLNFGTARNQVPGSASLEAEIRSFDATEAKGAAETITKRYTDHAEKNNLECKIAVDSEASSFSFDKNSSLAKEVEQALIDMHLKPIYEETYGCFDANFFAGKGKQVVVMGAAYYNPHGPEEYVSVGELEQLSMFIKKFCCRQL